MPLKLFATVLKENLKVSTILFLILLHAMPGLLYEAQCDYLMGTQIISCENSIRSIKDVTDLIGSETNVVIIKGGQELRITRASHRCDSCKHISTYQISRIDDLEIESEGFGGLTNLLHLKISENGLHRLENKIFYGLEKLEILDLTNCSINYIGEKAFEGLINLESLDLANNDIKTITPKMFKSLANLATLVLYNNKIEKLELNSLSALEHLHDLDLSNNKLKRVDARVFNRIPQLSYLYLSFNQIEVITGNLQCSNLKFLYIKENRLQEIPEKLLAFSSSLVDIDFSDNSIQNIHPRAFSNLNALLNLNLRNNSGLNVDALIFGRQRPLITV